MFYDQIRGAANDSGILLWTRRNSDLEKNSKVLEIEMVKNGNFGAWWCRLRARRAQRAPTPLGKARITSRTSAELGLHRIVKEAGYRISGLH